MGIGELLDAAIRLYRAHWKTLIAIVAFVVLPFNFLQGATFRAFGPSVEPGRVQTFEPGQRPAEVFPEDVGALVVLGLLFVVVGFVVIGGFLTAAIVRAAADSYLGDQPSVGRAYRAAWTRLGSLLFIILLTGLVVAAPLLLVAALALLLREPLVLLPGVFAFIGFGLFFYVSFVFAPAVLIVEGHTGTRALGRSWRLAGGHRWKILGAVLLAGLIGAVVSAIVGLPLTIPAMFIGPGAWPLQALGQALGSIVTSPFTMMIPVLLYFDMRIRKEGFDIAVMAQQLERPGASG